jgi:hypothetical protein
VDISRQSLQTIAAEAIPHLKFYPKKKRLSMSMEVFASYTKWCPDARTTADLKALGDDTPLPEITLDAWTELGEIAVALAKLVPHEQRAAFNGSFGELFDPDRVRMDLPLPGEADGDEPEDEEAAAPDEELGREDECAVLAVFSPASCKKISALLTGQDLESFGEYLGKSWNRDWRCFESPEDVVEALECIAGCFEEAGEGDHGLMFCAI